MSEALSPEEEIRRGHRASQILNDDIFSSAVNRIREAMLAGIRHSAFADEKLREKLCQRYAVLEDILGELQSVMETGQLAAEEIRRKSLFEQAKEFLNG